MLFLKETEEDELSSWHKKSSWHKNYYHHAYSSPCDTPTNCNKTHEEGDQKQHSKEVIWTSSLVHLVRRLVVVHQCDLYILRQSKRNFTFTFLCPKIHSLKQFKWSKVLRYKIDAGLKVNDQLVAYVTRFSAVRLKIHVWSHHHALKAKLQCDFSGACSPGHSNVLRSINTINIRYIITRQKNKKVAPFFFHRCVLYSSSLSLISELERYFSPRSVIYTTPLTHANERMKHMLLAQSTIMSKLKLKRVCVTSFLFLFKCAFSLTTSLHS